MILNLPYAALRAFEAVARHGSFSEAAEELGVGQSAVSQHVKALEEWLGHDLITRGPKRSLPTRDGARLALSIADGLGQISEVCEDIRDKQRDDRTIVISCHPGFAFIWLFPRLLSFDQTHPDFAISITTDTGLRGVARAEADIAIRYGTGDFPGFAVIPLMHETLCPVCAPGLLSGAKPLRHVADLAHHTQIRDEFAPTTTDLPTWEYWARETGQSLPTPARIRSFSQSNMVVQATIQGDGVAMGRSPLVMDALRDGRLVQPFPISVPSPLNYWLVYPEDQRRARKIALFLDWITTEARIQAQDHARLYAGHLHD
ncbi:MAG: LysR substrate-binding domain-containing protein [Marivita sp.]|uniref:LysR substrate-binding domain-containing protein n=1 Tax=Marivita sp. TaxID=2003365 RepID=UPI0025C504AE|nr:LysR substrate-binding domain-containing protein [Marivita sp.]MCI5111458.1 LysR substrate-binding domain-containing protein [Marivita sp.]